MIKDFDGSSQKVALRHLFTLARQHGLSAIFFRYVYEAQHRLGLMERKFPIRKWDELDLTTWLKEAFPCAPDEYRAYRQESSPAFFFSSPNCKGVFYSLLRRTMGDGMKSLIAQADQAAEGTLIYFERTLGDLGIPINWHYNPLTGQRIPSDIHWSKLSVFSPETGDIKFYWEPSRFSIAYKLTRAYWATGREKYPRIFWELVESWRDANQPQVGVNWYCGQEMSLRLMAWIFSLYGMLGSPHTTAERLTMLSIMIAVKADRIERNISFARSLKNNHAISEGVGLWTVGILFPEFKAAERWRELGRRILEEEAQRQIYDDGSYIQQSTNYHRLMLQDYLWAIRLGELNEYALSPLLSDRVREAGNLLYQLQDKLSGGVPNYGSNDGALILPLNTCDYRDFRPALGSIHYMYNRTRLYDHGPWDEDLLWLYGPEALDAPRGVGGNISSDTSVGGYYSLHGERSWGMIRCATFRDRPFQADMLHFDLWRNGINVACDPGSYLYYAEQPWDNSLVSTNVHNTVSVDGLDQMERGPRFLWLNWLKSQKRHFILSTETSMSYFEGEHYGYERLPDGIVHRRAVLKAGNDTWIILDDLLGYGEHEFRLHWLLADLPFEVDTEKMHLSLDTGLDCYGLSLGICIPKSASGTFDVVRGSENSAPRGWHSPYYGVRIPALSVALSITSKAPCRFVSLFAQEKPHNSLTCSTEQILFENKRLGLVTKLLPPGSQSMIKEVTIDREAKSDHLNIV